MKGFHSSFPSYSGSMFGGMEEYRAVNLVDEVTCLGRNCLMKMESSSAPILNVMLSGQVEH